MKHKRGSDNMAGKPNILIIWGDDIGWFNISAYNHGIMGYRTPKTEYELLPLNARGN